MKRAQRAELRSSPKANQKFEACIPNRRSRKPPLDVARPRATLQVQEIIYFVGQPDRTPDARQSSAAKEISRGDAEPRRMKGGNEASAASGITHSPERRTKRRELFIPNRRSQKPPLDVARPRATLQVQEIIYFVGQPARTPGARQFPTAEEISRKVRKNERR